MRIVVAGGSGCLGGAVVRAAAAAGHSVVAVSRRPADGLPLGVQHQCADLRTGHGLAAALVGADVVIDAVNSMRGARQLLVQGTTNLLAAAAAADVRHFVGISIVGIDQAPNAYYRAKVAQERVIEASPVPWSLLRATQFHDLIAKLARGKFGIVVAPRGALAQPICVDEVAARLVAIAGGLPAGRVADLAGPAVAPFAEFARMAIAANGRRRLLWQPPLFGALGRFLRGGGLCAPASASGRKTFADWLAQRR